MKTSRSIRWSGWVIAACVAVSGANLSALSSAPGVPPLPAEQRLRLNEAFHLVETLGPAVWPGFNGRQAPVVLSVGDVEYLLNRTEPLNGFEAVSGDTFRDRPVFARERVFSPALLATFPVNGVTSVVIGTAERTERSVAAWVLTVAHELFHVFQAERELDEKVLALAIGPPDESDWHLDYPYPYDDEAVRNAMHLLGYNLFRCVQHPDDADADAVTYDARVAHEALENLLLLLDLRFDEPRHAAYFRYQTGKEGVARYVEYRLAGLAAQGSYEPLPGFARSVGGAEYATIWNDHFASGLIHTIKHAGRVSSNRVEFYGLGLGLALTLDRVQPDWKKSYFEEDLWLDDLLHRALDGTVAGCRVRP